MDDQQLFRVIMPAADIEPSQRFYARLLDQPGMRISPGRHYFRCGSVTLAVYSPAADGDDRTPYANFDHIYLAVADLDAHFLRANRSAACGRRPGTAACRWARSR
jgi:catechol 2,3-dioxygenase-like lactoylglutathione lyase family enzyme